MVLKALLFSISQYVLMAILGLMVAGIIKLIYRLIHRREAPKEEAK